ncbi:D-alanyl-D-alanine carboxypeptidase [Candidatus Parcubacteria bacterium]|nr:MAG: D-alanyl-D-alanine carboxypeptidase [Candidatus Parcubacteria bacterium]
MSEENGINNFKSSKLIFFLLIFIFILFLVRFFIDYYFSNTDKKINVLLSPLPFSIASSLNIGDVLFYWKPKIDKVYDIGIEKPSFSADAVISYDLTSNKLLYEKNVKERLPIASLTKIMTAIIAIENEDIKKEIVINKRAAAVGENSMGLSEGEILKLKDLLYGLVLPSGNDAAEAIAEGSRFGRDNFVYMMNKKAEDLGLTDTHFTNPSGLEGDGKQYSSVYDLLVITRYGLLKKEFARVAATFEYVIPYSESNKAFYLRNDTNLLTSYPGVKGVKTGFTDEAGLCLVTYLEHNGHKIIAVILNSQNRREEMKELLDYSLKTLGEKPPYHP